MKNFIFKSDADFHKILFNKLEIILRVLKEQRLQLDRMEYLSKKLLIDNKLQKQVDEYFDETSHQTDNEDKEPD